MKVSHQFILTATAAITSIASGLVLSLPATAQPINNTISPSNDINNSSNTISKQRNYIGPSINIGGATTFGIGGKFGLSDNISIRPKLLFGNGATLYGGAVTYDLPSENLTPYAGVEFLFGNGRSQNVSFSASLLNLVIGADLNVGGNFIINGQLSQNLSNSVSATDGVNSASGSLPTGGTTIALGAGFKF